MIQLDRITKRYHKSSWKDLDYESRQDAADLLDGFHTFVSITLCADSICEKCECNLEKAEESVSKCMYSCPMPDITIELGWHIDGFISEVDFDDRIYSTKTGNFDSYIGRKMESYASSITRAVSRKYLTPTQFIKALKKNGFEEIY